VASKLAGIWHATTLVENVFDPNNVLTPSSDITTDKAGRSIQTTDFALRGSDELVAPGTIIARKGKNGYNYGSIQVRCPVIDDVAEEERGILTLTFSVQYQASAGYEAKVFTVEDDQLSKLIEIVRTMMQGEAGTATGYSRLGALLRLGRFAL